MATRRNRRRRRAGRRILTLPRMELLKLNHRISTRGVMLPALWFARDSIRLLSISLHGGQQQGYIPVATTRFTENLIERKKLQETALCVLRYLAIRDKTQRAPGGNPSAETLVQGPRFTSNFANDFHPKC